MLFWVNYGLFRKQQHFIKRSTSIITYKTSFQSLQLVASLKSAASSFRSRLIASLGAVAQCDHKKEILDLTLGLVSDLKDQVLDWLKGKSLESESNNRGRPH